MFISSEQMFHFLMQLAILLGGARAMGEVARRLRQPVVLGEILAGVLLGESVLGWVSPGAFGWLFPRDITGETMLHAIEIVGLLLLLLVAGLEIDLTIVKRQGRLIVLTGVGTVAIPFILGVLVGYAFPHLQGVARENQLGFSLLLGTALTISAIPVIVRLLRELNIFKSDLGMLIMGAAIIANLAGWLAFSVVTSASGEAARLSPLASRLGLTIVFVVVCIVLGRRMADRVLGWVQANLPWPGGVLTLMMVSAMVGAAISEAIGIQAIFGAFMVGVMIGESPRLRDQTRRMLDEFVGHVFAPIVFAAPMLHVNFVSSFRVDIVVGIVVIACAAKLLGSAIGARTAGLGRLEALAVGAALNARGEMGIILAVIARQYELIDERLFVALVTMALVTTLMAAPLMQHVLRRLRPYDLRNFLRRDLFVSELRSRIRRTAIRELCEVASRAVNVPAEELYAAVWEREETMGTGIGDGIAVPHARISGIAKPCVVLGRSRRGIDFDAPDGASARLIFLLLTPRDDAGAQVQMLAHIARALHSPSVRAAFLDAEEFDQIRATLDTALPQQEFLPR